MENVLISIVCIAMLLIGAGTMSMSALNSVAQVSDSVKESERIANDIRNTAISHVSTTVLDNGARLEVMLKNDGKTDLASFKAWDVLLRLQDTAMQWLPYSTGTPGWTVGGIYFNGGSETYNPNIFNPMETLKLFLKPSTPAVKNTNNLVTISTPNGALCQVLFNYR